MGRLNERTWGRFDQIAMYRDMNLSSNKRNVLYCNYNIAKCKLINPQKIYNGLLIYLRGTF